jgi:predicted PurR-regulated permease PerM
MAMPKFLKDYGVVLALFGALLIAFVSGFLVISGQMSQQTSSLHTKIDDVNKDLAAQMGKVETRATKLESAVKALGDNQSNPLKGLVHDLLAAAANALPNKPQVAARAISAADSLIVTLKKQKQSADAEYFKNMVSAINELSDRVPRAMSTVFSAGFVGQ